MSDLDRVIHQARGANREHAREAGCAVGQALDEHNKKIKERDNKRFEGKIKDLTNYYRKKVESRSDYFER